MKVVTLLPSATEIVGALVPHEDLVAISHECDFPIEVTDRPRITGSIIPKGLDSAAIDAAVSAAFKAQQPLYRVDGDMLAELKPDLIVTQGLCDVCALNANTVNETIMALPEALPAGTEILSLMGQDLDGVMQDIQNVGAAVDRAEAATAWVSDLRDRWEQLETSTPSSRPRIAMLEWTDPLFFGGHWVPEMVNVAGGIDVLGAPGRASGRCMLDDVIAADPDFITVIACGQNLQQNAELARTLAKNPQFANLRAVRAGDFWVIDANSYFSRPAPRIVDGAEILRQIVRGARDGIAGAERLVIG